VTQLYEGIQGVVSNILITFAPACIATRNASVLLRAPGLPDALRAGLCVRFYHLVRTVGDFA